MSIIKSHCGSNWNLKVRIELRYFSEFCRRSLPYLVAILIPVTVGGCDASNSVTIETSNDATRLVENQTVPDPLFIRLAGTEHTWRAEYLSPNGTSSTKSVNVGESDIHVPLGANVVFILKSNDYIYSMAIPAFGVKEMAVPDLEFRMSVQPMQYGHYPLVGEEPCGTSGKQGPGKLIVESPTEFQNWLRMHK